MSSQDFLSSPECSLVSENGGSTTTITTAAIAFTTNTTSTNSSLGGSAFIVHQWMLRLTCVSIVLTLAAQFVIYVRRYKTARSIRSGVVVSIRCILGNLLIVYVSSALLDCWIWFWPLLDLGYNLNDIVVVVFVYKHTQTLAYNRAFVCSSSRAHPLTTISTQLPAESLSVFLLLATAYYWHLSSSIIHIHSTYMWVYVFVCSSKPIFWLVSTIGAKNGRPIGRLVRALTFARLLTCNLHHCNRCLYNCCNLLHVWIKLSN